MTLHEAIEKLLQDNRRNMTTNQIAEELNNNRWYTKKDGSKITNYQIHGRTKNYPHIFNREGSMVSLVGHETNKPTLIQNKPKTSKFSNQNKDEQYVLDLCDKILELTSLRQHKFDFLIGDANEKGLAAKLPVDSYYHEINLVIEYREKQHTEIVNFFDKPNRTTVSGVHRGVQRKIYDERRREILPKQGIDLIELSYSDFKYDNQKRIVRDVIFDELIIKNKLKFVIDKKNHSK